MDQVLSEARFDVYRAVTDKIVQAIEMGAGEFVMPWHRSGPALGRPTNASTRARYQGVNVLVLWADSITNGYAAGWWATYDQWKRIGGQVRKGEHGTTIVFYKKQEPSDAEVEEARPRLMARAFRVFNVDQVEGWAPPTLAPSDPVETIAQAEEFVRSTKVEINVGGDVACYRRDLDVVEMPDRSRFVGSPTASSTETYYATLLHELTHWSGASHRLARDFGERFGDDAYAMEELVAELGAAFLCADLEIANEPRPDHAAYLATWLRVLKADKRAIFTAAQKAKEAVTYLDSLFLDERS